MAYEPKHFEIPQVSVNTEGWGPCSFNEKFTKLPFHIYNKEEPISKIIEFHQQGSMHKNKNDGFISIDDSFISTDKVRKEGRKTAKRIVSHKQQRLQQKNNANNDDSKNENYDGTSGYNRGAAKPKIQKNTYRKPIDYNRAPSVEIKKTWTFMGQFECSNLLALNTKILPESKTVVSCGEIQHLRPEVLKVTPSKGLLLPSLTNYISYSNVTTIDDDVIEALAGTGEYNVLATDQAMALLMLAGKTAVPWDLKVIKKDNILILQERNGVNDLLTVDETSADPVTDEEKLHLLRYEATVINNSFRQFILDGESIPNEEYNPNPFFEEDEESTSKPSSTLYSYREFVQDDFHILLRTELHGMENKYGKDVSYNAYALNEWNMSRPKASLWRNSLQKNSGSTLITELKNNNLKMSKWILESCLSGAESIKLGFVSRVGDSSEKYDQWIAKHCSRHSILAIQNSTPAVLASNAMLNINNLWATALYLLKEIKKHEDGSYYLVKDPLRNLVKLYAVPEEEESEEDDSEEDSEEDSEDSEEDSEDSEEDSEESEESEDDSESEEEEEDDEE